MTCIKTQCFRLPPPRRLAASRLLADVLPAEATYIALDLSDEMVRLAAARLAPWTGRARVAANPGPAADSARRPKR